MQHRGNKDITPENISDKVYNSLVEVIKKRLVNGDKDQNNQLELSLPNFMIPAFDNDVNEFKRPSESRHRDKNCHSQQSNGETDDDNMSISSVNTTENNPYSSFSEALNNLIHLYNKVEDSVKLLDPPPVPITSMFRMYNPHVSNLFDSNQHHDTNDLNISSISQIYRDSIASCLVDSDIFTRNNKSLEMDKEMFFAEFNRFLNDKGSCKLLKVLFGWYFSGYFTGRMEAITQFHKPSI
ncbi:hypothetical protein BEWA_019710 [Theileria equi strain WA]|uniref:Uncharacterized protein n=1 Tax=Theileria equi strain WA TaxID=1537102 RepID=L0AU92_THEEQ|nr:hypothetical protein BEWA_019710 [Theileria equi strain WA]AFZ79125.1 hypothetical protein BEWA_019710 [Theileria equi strain WA]|eukprot:XP_004828791.1 hypothetical protein BEWA_019710 [Theileria equi strain WA]